MTFLPERHRSSPPQVWNRGDTQHGRPAHLDGQQWRPVRRGPSMMPILLTVAFAAAFGWLVRSAIDHPRTPPRLASAPAPSLTPFCTTIRFDDTVQSWPTRPAM
jgi:hypothetical protein